MNQTPYKPLYQFLGLSITISITFPCFLCSAFGETHYANCAQPFKCGDPPSILGELKYPFWGINRESYCGEPGFKLDCINNTPIIPDSPYKFRVMGINPQIHEITVAIPDFRHNLCPSFVFNRTITNAFILDLNWGYFDISDSVNSLLTILYGCPSKLGHQLSWSGQYSCSTNDSVSVHFVTHTANVALISECASALVLPILQESAEALAANASALTNALDGGFKMKWFMQGNSTNALCAKCLGSGGECGYDWSENQFTCYCPDSTNQMTCPPPKQGG